MNTLSARASILLLVISAAVGAPARAASTEGAPCRQLGEREGRLFCSGEFVLKSDDKATLKRIELDLTQQGIPAGHMTLSVREGQSARIESNASTPRLPPGFALSLVPIEGPDAQYALVEASLPGEAPLRETIVFSGMAPANISIGSVGITARIAPR